MTGETTAADYAWLDERYGHLMEAYCVTLVGGLTPEALLTELKAEPEPGRTGVDALTEPCFDAWDHWEGDSLFVGVTAVGDWSLMVESNDFPGITTEVALPLSRGRRVVSHFRNVNAVTTSTGSRTATRACTSSRCFRSPATAATPTNSSRTCGSRASTSGRAASGTTACAQRPPSP